MDTTVNIPVAQGQHGRWTVEAEDIELEVSLTNEGIRIGGWGRVIPKDIPDDGVFWRTINNCMGIPGRIFGLNPINLFKNGFLKSQLAFYEYLTKIKEVDLTDNQLLRQKQFKIMKPAIAFASILSNCGRAHKEVKGAWDKAKNGCLDNKGLLYAVADLVTYSFLQTLDDVLETVEFLRKFEYVDFAKDASCFAGRFLKEITFSRLKGFTQVCFLLGSGWETSKNIANIREYSNVYFRYLLGGTLLQEINYTAIARDAKISEGRAKQYCRDQGVLLGKEVLGMARSVTYCALGLFGTAALLPHVVNYFQCKTAIGAAVWIAKTVAVSESTTFWIKTANTTAAILAIGYEVLIGKATNKISDEEGEQIQNSINGEEISCPYPRKQFVFQAPRRTVAA